ncbi:MAG TPA: hexose kinase [Abditibacteriaceae bacterium]|nr:hexose kinase [Abditibacteriaceae bacterium]
MFLTVTPNLCLERTVVIENFAVGQVHRIAADNVRVNAGGKGINAARVASRLGCQTLAIAWVGSTQHAWFRAQLVREGVLHDLVEVATDTRVCINILDGAGGKTEIVEAGSPLQNSDGARMVEKFDSLLPRAELIAICGSYPPGSDAEFDSHLTVLTHRAKRNGRRVIVDGKGKSFDILMSSGQPPWCIKPNLDEARQLLAQPIAGEAAEVDAVRALLGRGVEVVLLSCGARGAYLGTAQEIWFLQSPRIREMSPVGSGDALVGAFAARFLEAGDLVEAARWGVAAGAANAARLRAGFCERADIEVLLPQVQVEVIR